MPRLTSPAILTLPCYKHRPYPSIKSLFPSRSHSVFESFKSLPSRGPSSNSHENAKENEINQKASNDDNDGAISPLASPTLSPLNPPHLAPPTLFDKEIKSSIWWSYKTLRLSREKGGGNRLYITLSSEGEGGRSPVQGEEEEGNRGFVVKREKLVFVLNICIFLRGLLFFFVCVFI